MKQNFKAQSNYPRRAYIQSLHRKVVTKRGYCALTRNDIAILIFTLTVSDEDRADIHNKYGHVDSRATNTSFSGLDKFISRP